MSKPITAEVLLHGSVVGHLTYDRGGSRFEYTDDLTSPSHAVLGQTFEDDPVTADDSPAVSGPALERWSLAGVQLKWSVHSSRLTVPVRGPEGWWIAKLPDRTVANLAENEYLTMRWLASAGFDVPAVDLVPAKHVPDIPAGFAAPADAIYLVRRFDWTNEGKIHVEDFAQVADVEPEYKYGQLGASHDAMGAVIRQLTGDNGFHRYVERLAAVILTGNTDAHLKNWALWYPDRRTPLLAPVYDFHSLTVYESRFRYSPLALTVAGEQMPAAIDVDHFRRLAAACGSDPETTAARVNETISTLRETWSSELRTEAQRLFPALADHYDRRLAELPLARP